MTNDAKLGLLAGVVGVITAAVLFSRPPPDQPARAPPAAGAPAALPSPVASVNNVPAAVAATPPKSRPEPEGQPTSRTNKKPD